MLNDRDFGFTLSGLILLDIDNVQTAAVVPSSRVGSFYADSLKAEDKSKLLYQFAQGWVHQFERAEVLQAPPLSIAVRLTHFMY